MTKSDAADGKTVLVTGGGGFLGGYVCAALDAAGWRVIRGLRRVADEPAARACDLARLHDATAARELLAGVDAVVNVAGILRERGRDSFQAVHVDGPRVLAEACVALGIRRLVQISALGDPADGEFIASKHRFDAALLAMPLTAVVLRPSLVYAVDGSYGGTSLLRALAGLPGVQFLPGRGEARIQPLAAEDLGALVAAALEAGEGGLHEFGGPRVMSLREWLAAWRGWLRVPALVTWRVQEALIALVVRLSEWFGSGPLGLTMWRMLRRGNVVDPAAQARTEAAFDWRPRELAEVLAARPSQVQDRWQAQLHFLAPLLRVAVAALWLLSAAAGLLASREEILGLAGTTALANFAPVALVRGLAGVDAVLGLLLLAAWRPRLVTGLMLISVLGYTAALGTVLPALWLAPLGGLAKNLVLVPALAVLWVLVERR